MRYSRPWSCVAQRPPVPVYYVMPSLPHARRQQHGAHQDMATLASIMFTGYGWLWHRTGTARYWHR